MPSGIYVRTNNSILKKKYYKEHPEALERLRTLRFGKKHSQKTKIKMSRWHKKHNWMPPIETRFRKGQRGKLHPAWRGGLSLLPYSIDWTRSLRISIRERDFYTCRLCGKKQGDYAFDVHHINYNKKDCSPNNLITLCRSCHIKTNGKRSYWIELLNLINN